MVVATPARGKRLIDAVGAQKVAFGRPAGDRVTAFGYPGTTPPPRAVYDAAVRG
ncbi:hypothetical protein [Streptomyces sp. NPDC055506]